MSFTKKLRFLFRFFSVVIRKQYKMVILGLLLGALSFLVLPTIIKYVPQPKRIEKIGLVGQYETSSLPEKVLADISYGLTKVSPKGEPTTSLATSWRAENEGKDFIFDLSEEEFVWHDGEPLTSSDINYNFKDASFKYQGNQLSFSLKEPFAPFPLVVSRPLFKKGLIGLGDYKVKKIEKVGKYVKAVHLSAFKDSSLPTKIYRFYNTEKDLKTGFNLGEINRIENIFDIEGLSLGKSVTVNKTIMYNAYLGVFFNTSKPPFQEKNFRQALAYAIPKATDETRALGPISPNSWVYNSGVKPYKQDLTNAQKLLEQDKEALKNLKITISTLPQYESTANMVRDSWKQIGIDSEVKILTFIPDDFDVLIIAREIPDDPDQYFYWHKTQPGNICKFDNARINKLLEDGRKVIDREARKDIYFDFQRFLIEESPVVFLTHPLAYTVIRN
jgi:ABC-type transport system substrate-binding protein